MASESYKKANSRSMKRAALTSQLETKCQKTEEKGEGSGVLLPLPGSFVSTAENAEKDYEIKTGFICHVCGFTVNTNHFQQIFDHFLLHEKSSKWAEAKVFECRAVCSRLCRIFQSGIYFEDDTEPCDSKFLDAESLYRHVKLHVKLVKTEDTEGCDTDESTADFIEWSQDSGSCSNQCKICCEVHLRRDVLFKHVLGHFDGVVFYCRVCFETVKCYQAALNHFYRHKLKTLPSYGVSILCHICRFTKNTFEYAKILDHFYQHHDHESKASQAAFECKSVYNNLGRFVQCKLDFEYDIMVCDAKLTDIDMLIVHVKQHIRDKPCDNNESSQIGGICSNQCKICGEAYFKRDILFKHVLGHFEGVRFYCRVCFEIVRCYQSALHHIYNHRMKTLPSYGVSILCHICGFTENTFEYWKILDHFYQHHDQCKPSQAIFECKSVYNNLGRFAQCKHDIMVCDAKFTNIDLLVEHVKRHIGIKTKECDKNDPLPDSCKTTDKVSRDLSCKMCGIVCSRIDHLFKHFLAHFAGIKFFCWICFLTFENYALALTHCKEHKAFSPRPYGVGLICHICGYTEGSNRYSKILDNFFSLHQNDNPSGVCMVECRTVCASLQSCLKDKLEFECGTEMCQASFASIASLCKHVEQHLIKRNSVVNSDLVMMTTNQTTESNNCQVVTDIIQIGSISGVREIKDVKTESPALPKIISADIGEEESEYVIEITPVSQANPESDDDTKPSALKCVANYSGSFVSLSEERTKSPKVEVQGDDIKDPELRQVHLEDAGMKIVKQDFQTAEGAISINAENHDCHTKVRELLSLEVKIAKTEEPEQCLVVKTSCPVGAVNDSTNPEPASLVNNLSKAGHGSACIVCGAVYNRINFLMKHVLSHYEEVTFFCRVCLETFGHYNCALDHCGQHQVLSVRSYGVGLICHLCGYSDTTCQHQKILDHFWLHENDTDKSVAGQAMFKCKPVSSSLGNFFHCEVVFKADTEACDAEFTDAKSLFEHVKQHVLMIKKGRRDSNKDTSLGKLAVPGNSVQWYGRLECKICAAHFPRYPMLFRHIVLHFEGLVFFCQVCFQTFRNYEHALTHNNIHTLSQCCLALVCYLCGKVDGCSDYRKIVHHLWEHRDGPIRVNHVVFGCKTIILCLRQFIRREFDFKPNTGACDAKFNDAEALCAHVKRHLMVQKSYGSAYAGREADSNSPVMGQMTWNTTLNSGEAGCHSPLMGQSKLNANLNIGVADPRLPLIGQITLTTTLNSGVADSSPLLTEQIKTKTTPNSNSLYCLILPKKTVGNLSAASSGPAMLYPGNGKANQSVTCPDKRNASRLTVPKCSPVSQAHPKSEGQPLSNVSTVVSTVSSIVIRDVTPVSQNDHKFENHVQPPEKRLALEVTNTPDKASIFTCQVCQKCFLAEHLYHQHLIDARH